MPALAAFNYGISVGGAGSWSACGYGDPEDGVYRGTPSGSVFVGARWERSEWYVGVSTAFGLWYSCGGLGIAPFQVLETGYLVEVGEVRLGGFAGVGNSFYVAGGFHIERPIVAGPVELAPAMRLVYAFPLTIEGHVLLRVTPSGTRRGTSKGGGSS